MVAQQHSCLLYNVVHSVYAVCRLQVSVVLFISPIRVFGRGVGDGHLLVPLHQCVCWLFGKAALLQVPLLVILVPLGTVCPYFGNEGVLVFVVFYGHREAHVLLYRILDLVELFPHIVGGVVLGDGDRRPVVAALLPPATHAPQQCRDQHQDPDHNEDGAQERY